jgi:hypothetical protein
LGEALRVIKRRKLYEYRDYIVKEITKEENMNKLIVVIFVTSLFFLGCEVSPDVSKSTSSDSIVTGSSSSSMQSSIAYLYSMDSPALLSQWDHDNSWSLIEYAQVDGQGCFRLSADDSGESKMQTELTPKLSSWIGSKLKFSVRLPQSSNVSNIGIYLYAKEPFTWIDYNQVMGPFQKDKWLNISIPLTSKMINCAVNTNGGKSIYLGFTFFTLTGTAPGVSSPMNTNIYIKGIYLQ